MEVGAGAGAGARSRCAFDTREVSSCPGHRAGPRCTVLLPLICPEAEWLDQGRPPLINDACKQTHVNTHTRIYIQSIYTVPGRLWDSGDPYTHRGGLFPRICTLSRCVVDSKKPQAWARPRHRSSPKTHTITCGTPACGCCHHCRKWRPRSKVTTEDS